ncbi:MAG TPA: hypothetical protein VFQ53_19125 [Kofleriaceae bacterium]|nr:hypothetical protein [Kofleriaceae bacterium]
MIRHLAMAGGVVLGLAGLYAALKLWRAPGELPIATLVRRGWTSAQKRRFAVGIATLAIVLGSTLLVWSARHSIELVTVRGAGRTRTIERAMVVDPPDRPVVRSPLAGDDPTVAPGAVYVVNEMTEPLHVVELHLGSALTTSPKLVIPPGAMARFESVSQLSEDGRLLRARESDGLSTRELLVW